MPMSSSQMRDLVHAIAFGEQPALLARMGTRNLSGAASLAIRNAGWWDDSNIVGLCYAPKVRRGRVEELSLQVLVRTKRPRHRVPARRQIPPFIALSDLGLRGKVATDVREVGSSRLDVLVSSARPVRPGFSIGHWTGGSGTLACAVRSKQGVRLGLSCSHVIAPYGHAQPGDQVMVPSRDHARLLGLRRKASFGTLERIAPIGFGFDRAPFNVDAATVRPDSPDALDNQLAKLNIRPNAVRQEAVSIDLMVRKVGATTEDTLGSVVALSAVLSLPFQDTNGQERNVWFTDMVGISRFTAPGDSGALVLDSAEAAVGLHMGSFEGMSVCMPIRRVLESLECELDTSSGPTAVASPLVV